MGCAGKIYYAVGDVETLSLDFEEINLTNFTVTAELTYEGYQDPGITKACTIVETGPDPTAVVEFTWASTDLIEGEHKLQYRFVNTVDTPNQDFRLPKPDQIDVIVRKK